GRTPIMLRLRFLLSVFILILATTTQAAELPDTFSNEYTSSALGFTITVKHELKQLPDGNYQMHFRAESWFASIDEVSNLKIDADKGLVVPLHYIYKRRIMGRDRDAELTFDWDTRTVTNNVQNTTWR